MQWATSELRQWVGVIAGIEPTTLVDFPGRVAATVFLGGCNFRCPYCHNVSLVLGPWGEIMTVAELAGWLEPRRGFLDGVCITGGEPTLDQSRLAAVCEAVRAAEMAVKVDTNGTRPEAIEALVDGGLVDYVAVDVKASPQRYAEAAGLATVDLSAIAETVQLLRELGAGHELRTTVLPRLHGPDDIRAIGEWLGGDSTYALQPFRPGTTLDPQWRDLPAPSPALMRELAEAAGEYFPRVEVRQ